MISQLDTTASSADVGRLYCKGIHYCIVVEFLVKRTELLGCKDIGIRKLECVAKTQFLCENLK